MKRILLTAALSALLTVPGWSELYTFTQISPAGEAINIYGGAAINSSGLTAWVYGFDFQTWNGSVNTYTPSISPGSYGTNIGLSDAGLISYTNYNTAYGEVYDLSNASITSFSDPGQSVTYAGGSSTNGLVASDAASTAGAWIWNGGSSFTEITYPGSHGQIYLEGVNSSGDVVGQSSCCGSGVSFLDVGGTFTTITVPGIPNGDVWAENLNNSDVVVGYVYTGTVEEGFLWQDGVGTIVNYPGATDTIIYGINSAGELVGEADFGNSGDGIVFTASMSTPEPASVSLLSGGALLIAGVWLFGKHRGRGPGSQLP